MVKVKEDLSAMCESRPASSSTSLSRPTPTTTSSSNAYGRKPRHHHHYPSHHYHHHYSYHHYCTFPKPAEGDANGSGTPARFYFGPGFEPQRATTAYNVGPSQAQNGGAPPPEYVVFFHVNPGVTINFQIGDSLEVLRGPVTVPMVSTNSSPPIAMPVQVPPGHVVQQIVDENGTLRHVILSTQHPPGLLPITSHNPQHYNVGPSNGSNGPPQTFYTQGIPQGFHSPHYTHFHTNLPPGAGHPIPTHPAGHSPPPFCKDERTHRRYIKLKKKLHEKQQKGSGDGDGRKDLVNGIRRNKEKGMNSVGTSEDGEESSSVQDEDDLHFITEILSSVQAPSVSELSSRSALLQWSAPARFSETSSSDSHELDISENDLRYEVLLSDKTKEMKYKSIYNGASQSCRIQDLRPGVEYSVRLQVHLDEIQGSASDPLKFTTPACEPDQPQPPKLLQRSKNVLLLRWNPTTSNGSHIIHYVLEYDEGKGGDFVELHKSRGNQHSLQKLTPATCYKFRLAAVNEIGKSVYSDVVAHCTSDNAPQQPDPPKLKRATITSLHLTWHRRPKDDEFNLSMNDPTNTYGYLPLYNGRDNEYVCSDLNRFTDYKFKLRASNEGGNSSWSEEVTFQTLPDRPARPSKPVVKGRIHAHSFRLKWESPSDTGGADISKYILEVNSGSGYDSIYVGTETEAVCDKLTPGTTYQLRVSCESLGGRSNFSDPCTVTTEAISPGQCPVARLHGKAKANSAVIRFTEPDYNGGAPILEYEAEMVNPDSSRILVHKSKEVECNLNNLQPGCEYVFMVRAVNRIGTGPWSEPLAFTSGAAPPDGFNQPTVVCKSPVSACVDWQVPQSNGAQITEYRLEISENNENFHQIYLGPSTTFDVKNLTPFTTYYFRVQASNSAGYGPYSPITATITPAAPPNPIQNPKCEPTATTITLTWNEPQNNGSPITYYNIEIADQVIQTPQPINHYTIQDLQPNTQYRIKLQAVNSVGPSPLSSTQKVTTLRLPPSPPKLECIGIGHNYLKLKWGEGKNPDYTQFSVEMINSRSSEYQCVYKGTAFTCKVNKLQELTTYNFRICASNDAGIGDFSKEYSFVTHIAPPAALKSPKVFDIDSRGCSLEWIPSRASCSDPIEYLVQVSRLKDQQFKQVYKGADTKCTLENLESGAEYCARVCPIRLCQSGELSGPFSPQANFSTPALEPSASSTRSLPTTGTPTHSHRPRSLMQTIFPTKKLKLEQHLVLFKATGVAMVGILLSLLICWFLNMK